MICCEVVRGMIVTPISMRKTTLVVRISNDDLGQSLSIADEDAGCMMHIPLEPLREYLKVIKR